MFEIHVWSIVFVCAWAYVREFVRVGGLFRQSCFHSRSSSFYCQSDDYSAGFASALTAWGWGGVREFIGVSG